MRFIEKRGNRFIFEGGYTDEEHELLEHRNSDFFEYIGKDIGINESLTIIHQPECAAYYKDIQAAVCMMQILIKEGLI